ncbi:C2H2 type zinc finger domain-containing protein [Colletotrichum karsti]|uniref:C2H2 type zinc finger domain-containing protein n=1 Tax=Colletotrichum karsti TaxID=1095194 RepID=A0A9P6LQH2_9PEZI|nr:C2H2 type zinc finger domain-containing protein [Colletotrichum karsti]KAF9882210.1 C2H2 type zinc finger domain-containing protein [Colletotrichum karsti]
MNEILTSKQKALYTTVSTMATLFVLVAQGRHTSLLTPEQREMMPESEFPLWEYGSKNFVVGMCCYATIVWTLKFNMLFFYRRLVAGQWVEKFIFPVMGLVGATAVAMALIILLTCRPITLMWQIRPDPGENCVPQNKVYFYSILVMNVTTDLCIIAIPIPVISLVRASIWRRLGVYFLFSLGVFVMTAAVIRVFLIFKPTGQFGPGAMWSIREDFVAIFVGQAPMIVPMFRKRFWQQTRSRFTPKSSQGSEGHELSSGMSSQKKKPRDPYSLTQMGFTHMSNITNVTRTEVTVVVPDIRSRCGFCGALLDTWAFRADHLADHFKMGQDMANWKGDWGFEEPVLDMVENSVPPYLIEYERFSPFPYQASGTPPESPRNAFGLLTLELNHFLRMFYDRTGNMPNNEEIQLEACRIVFASEVTSSMESDMDTQHQSWMRDLITSSEEITRRARFGPMRSVAESMMSVLQIKGKRSLFEDCPSEMQLQNFVDARKAVGFGIITDQELQRETSKIVISRGKDCGVSPTDFVANWLISLIGSSTTWLTAFKVRTRLSAAHEPLSIQPGTSALGSSSMSTFGSRSALQNESFQALQGRINAGAMETTAHDSDRSVHDIPEAGGSFLSQLGDFNTTFTSEIDLGSAALALGITPHAPMVMIPSPDALASPLDAGRNAQWEGGESPGIRETPMDPGLPPTWPKMKANYAFFNDANFNRWLAVELRRWVAATMSPNNPTCHIPTDQELQHQARFIVFEE